MILPKKNTNKNILCDLEEFKKYNIYNYAIKLSRSRL